MNFKRIKLVVIMYIIELYEKLKSARHALYKIIVTIVDISNVK